jgi:outer membrane immunogenic protein
MKKLFLAGVSLVALIAGPAMAADLARPVYRRPVVVAAPVFSWTGFYIGGNGGYARGNSQSVIDYETAAGAPFFTGNFGSFTPTGGFGGGQIGYNWQTGILVLGVETDIQGASISGSQTASQPYPFTTPPTATFGANSKLNWFGTLRGRIGVAWGPALFYVTGGLAYGGLNYGFTFSDAEGFNAANSSSFSRTGYTVGGGVEYAFTGNWTVKFEYQYIDLGSATISAPEFFAGAPTIYADTTSTSFRYQTFRVGLNYKFGNYYAPVVTK